MKKLLKKIIVLLTVLLFVPVGSLEAVSLRLKPSFSEHKIGDSFLVSVEMDTEGDCVNTVRVKLRYPNQIVDGKNFSKGGSVLDLWPEEPEIDDKEGIVSFAGGIPGGYCEEGFVTLAEVGFSLRETPGKIAEKITILDADLYLDDGEGTVLEEVATEDAYFTTIPQTTTNPSDPWEEKLKEDKTPPAEFSPRIISDSAINRGAYSLIFSTRDEETGVSHYEVAERMRIGFIEIGSKEWKEAQSPHLLEDQNLASVVRVRAIDGAGNERMEEIHPPYGYRDYLPWIILLLAVGGAIYKRKKNKGLKIEWF